MPDPYICSICGEKYLHEDLARVCERVPVEDLCIRLGSAFRCGDGLLGVLYNSQVDKQTHKISHALIRADLSEGFITSEVYVDRDYLRKIQRISDADFEKIKELIKRMLDTFKNSKAPHIQKIRELKLIQVV